MSTLFLRAACAALLASSAPLFAAAPEYVNHLVLSGNSSDVSGQGSGANQGRVGFFSDLYYDRPNNLYYALSDRGPGGGVYDYGTRVQQFTLDVDPASGAISNFSITKTILFKNPGGAQSFNGQNPSLLNGSKSNLGLSFDPEGFAVLPNGKFLVSDEYGPSVYEFTPTDIGGGVIEARLSKTYTPPANLLPRQADTTLNLVDGRPTITTGRQDNRGFEGLTVSPDGKFAFAVLQDPLVNEGSSNDGRRSPNVRIIKYDTATGESVAQFAYQLEALADINARLASDPFGATAQGRNIGLSSIHALSDTKFLVIERDNRGLGVDELVDATPDVFKPIGTKRVYEIDITGATDISATSLAGSNALPLGVVPVTKSLYLDIADELGDNSVTIAEKLEGLAFGPQLLNGKYVLLIGSDNDYSVTQNGSNEQFDVYYNPTTGEVVQVPLDSISPPDFQLVPGFLYAFVEPVGGGIPEPASLALLGLGATALLARRRR